MKGTAPRALLALLLAVTFATAPAGGAKQDAQRFIDSYTAQFLKLQYESAKAEWASNTHIVEGDTMNAYRTRMANEALAAFTGSAENIEQARRFLEERGQLPEVVVRQLDAILYLAANNPQTVPELVKARIKAEALQNERLYGFEFSLDGQPVSTNDIDDMLKTEGDLGKRLAAWEASKEVGVGLRDGLADLQRLRNETVRALGYDDYFQYQVSDFRMTTAEMLDLLHQFVAELRPLYRELHTYVRYELAERYGVDEVPDLIPAHWLPNRWGQDWSPLVTVEGLDLDGELREKEAKWLVEQAERFYVSLGFAKLPASFWELSDLYPLPEGAGYKKNNHASAWHMDLERDVRSLMSVIPNAEWYETTHHELGHVYYYISYTNPDVPPLLRQGANRAYHEAVGSMMGLAAMQRPFLERIGLFPEGQETDEIQTLLKEALNYVIFIPWSAGVMTDFEHALYAEELPPSRYNQRWWELKARYQGIAPPAPRGEEYCDAASKTHINNDAAQYYDYGLSYVLLFQLHDHVARNILHQSPRATSYYGSTELGAFLRTLLTPGANCDWRALTREAIGEEISAGAMLRYFEPLMAWLQEQNQGRTQTLPEV
ncbi:MAG: M2 family metallopeptidase [Candidatus Krumholzibacteria bacterium]|nr:M2 family metallopeptidase [Candidatus Krumholzibacteria bacterium]